MSKKHSPGFIAIVDEARKQIRECTVDEVVQKRQRSEPFRLLDVREDDEWRAGHIAGAEHLGKGVLERDVEDKIPNKAEPLILYCGGGFRSALAALQLKKMGYTDVMSMDGGWRAWTEKNLPTEK